MFRIRRRVTVLESRNEEEIESARTVLTGAGLDVKTWDSEPMPVGGCGAQMRPSDWSGRKTPAKAQSNTIHHLLVYKEDEEKARQLLSEN